MSAPTNPKQAEYDQAASNLARRYREAPTDGTRAAIMLEARRSLNVEIVEALLAQHTALVEALEGLQALYTELLQLWGAVDAPWRVLLCIMDRWDAVPASAALAKARGEVAP